MAYDAGSIVASADLDRTPFQQGLQMLKQQARDLERSGPNVPIGADTKEAEAKILSFQEHLDRLGRDEVTPRVNLGGVAAAEVQIAALEGQLNRLSRRGGVLGGIAGGGIGGGGTSGPGFFGRAASHAPRFASLALGAAIPAALPLAGLAAGAGAGLLTPTLAGLSGIVPFAAVASASIKKVATDVKTLTSLQAEYNAATTNKQRAAVLAKEHALWQSLDPAQRQAVKNVQGLNDSWTRFQKHLEPQTFGALSSGVKILQTLMKDFQPVTKAVGDEIISLEDRAGKAFKDPFWTHFFTDFLGKEAPRAVETLGTVTGNFFTGLAHLTEDFAPLGHDFESMLVRWSKRFEHWTQGSGPGKFVDWVEQNGPGAADALKALAHGLEGLGKGLMPIGKIELKALTPVLNFIGDLGDDHPKIITAVGGALLTVAAGLKAIAAINGIAGILGGIRGLGKGGGPGGIGGAISKAAPVPVYVTNWGAGGLPVPGGKTEPLPAGKSPWWKRFTSVLPAPAIVAGTYIATQGGDQAPGQGSIVSSDHGIVGQHSAVNASAQALAKLLGPNFSDAAHSNGSFTVLDTGKAVATIETKGTQDQIAALEALAKHYDNVGAALKAYRDGVQENRREQQALNDLLNVTPGKLDAASGATKRFSTNLLGLAGTAGKAGRQIGTDLGQGLIQSIEAQIPHATTAGKLLVAQTVKQMRLAAEANSPSKATARLGKDLADGLVLGFTQRMSDVRGLFEQATGGMVSRLALILARAQQDAQNRLAGARNQLSADLSARRGLASGIAGGLTGGADLAGAYINGRVGNLSGYLGNFAHDDRRLLRDLKLLDDKHLSPALLEQVARAGPIAGVALAENILSGRSGSIHHLDRLEGQIRSYSRRSGGLVAGARYDGQVASDRADVRDMLHELRHLNDNIDTVKQILRKSPHDYADALDAALSGAHHRHTARTDR